MKREIARYVTECDVYQRVKAEHLKSAGTLQPLPIPSWKWENIRMDFITGLPKTSQGYDPKGMTSQESETIVDRLTKSARFLSIKATYLTKQYAELYLTRIICLHGVPKTIISNRGPQFVARFWKSFHEAMGTDLTYSTAYHPQTDGQTERVNQILEDMLRACVLIYEKKWVTCLPFTEFSYNNSYQASIKISPFEALYGRWCRTPINWSESKERPFFGLNLVKDAEDQVKIIHENLCIAQSRQKTYADHRHRVLHFKVGDHVYLKVSPFKGTRHFQVRGKLAPRYVGPF
jgi:hypothetical protein